MIGGGEPITWVACFGSSPDRHSPMTAPNRQTFAEMPWPDHASALGASDVEHRVRRAQAALVFARTRTSNLCAPLVAALVSWLLWDVVEPITLLAWTGIMLAVMLWRELIYRRFVIKGQADTLKLGRQYEVALVVHGTVYGLIGTVLLPAHDAQTMAIMLATLVNITAVSLVVLSTNLRATLAFILPALLPAIADQLVEGGRIQAYAGVAMTMFLFLVVVESRKASEHARAMLRLRFQMDDLAAQRQQALGQAQRSSAVKGEFLATMSHEMRTPLHGILGITRLLQTACADADTQTRTHRLDMIERTGEHLLGLINDMLDHSKIEGGHLRLEPASFELAALVESVGDLARVAAGQKGLRLKLTLSIPSPCRVHADPSRLRQVLLNLTGNAIKFTEHGSISLTLERREDGAARFEVLDSGAGVPADQREAIFDAFHQVDGSFGRRHGGTGLGLTISRELARAMGGDLMCLEPLETGGRFVLTLPLPDAEAAPARNVPETHPPVLQGRVLLAEDNPVNAIVAETMLRLAGLSVDLVVDGEQAVAHAAATTYNLILMDCQMPGIDGFEATRRIRKQEREIGARPVPIVALTANALEADRERSIACGMNDHMAKPFRDAELHALLERHLR